MAITQADVDRLNAAIMKSELEVEYDGQRTRYRSIAEMQAALAHGRAELARQAAAGGGQRSAFGFSFTTGRGW